MDCALESQLKWCVMTLISRNAIFHVSRVVSFALPMVLVDELQLFSTRSIFLFAEKTLLPLTNQPSTSRVTKRGTRQNADHFTVAPHVTCTHATAFRTPIALINLEAS